MCCLWHASMGNRTVGYNQCQLMFAFLLQGIWHLCLCMWIRVRTTSTVSLNWLDIYWGDLSFYVTLVQRSHPVGRSFHLPGESAGNGAHWTEAGGEISSPVEAPGGRLRDRLGGTNYRPADTQAAAGPLGGEIEPKTWGKRREQSMDSFLKME